MNYSSFKAYMILSIEYYRMWCYIKSFIVSIIVIISIHYIYKFMLNSFTIPKVKLLNPKPNIHTSLPPPTQSTSMEDELNQFISSIQD